MNVLFAVGACMIIILMIIAFATLIIFKDRKRKLMRSRR